MCCSDAHTHSHTHLTDLTGHQQSPTSSPHSAPLPKLATTASPPAPRNASPPHEAAQVNSSSRVCAIWPHFCLFGRGLWCHFLLKLAATASPQPITQFLQLDSTAAFHPHTYSLTHALTHCRSLTHRNTLTHCYSLSLPLAATQPYSLAASHPLAPTHSHALTRSLTHPIAATHTHLLQLHGFHYPHTLTHTHAHIYTHTLTHTHTSIKCVQVGQASAFAAYASSHPPPHHSHQSNVHAALLPTLTPPINPQAPNPPSPPGTNPRKQTHGYGGSGGNKQNNQPSRRHSVAAITVRGSKEALTQELHQVSVLLLLLLLCVCVCVCVRECVLLSVRPQKRDPSPISCQLMHTPTSTAVSTDKLHTDCCRHRPVLCCTAKSHTHTHTHTHSCEH